MKHRLAPVQTQAARAPAKVADLSDAAKTAVVTGIENARLSDEDLMPAIVDDAEITAVSPFLGMRRTAEAA